MLNRLRVPHVTWGHEGYVTSALSPPRSHLRLKTSCTSTFPLRQTPPDVLSFSMWVSSNWRPPKLNFLDLPWNDCSKARNTHWPLIGYIPNEIAIFHRDNDQQNHWFFRGTQHFQTHPYNCYHHSDPWNDCSKARNTQKHPFLVSLFFTIPPLMPSHPGRLTAGLPVSRSRFKPPEQRVVVGSPGECWGLGRC